MLRDDRLIYTAGSFGQYIFADYDNQVAIVFMANWSNNGDLESNENLLRIVRSVGEHIKKHTKTPILKSHNINYPGGF